MRKEYNSFLVNAPLSSVRKENFWCVNILDLDMEGKAGQSYTRRSLINFFKKMLQEMDIMVAH